MRLSGYKKSLTGSIYKNLNYIKSCYIVATFLIFLKGFFTLFVGGELHVHLPPLIAMSNESINYYAEQLKQLCGVCRKNKKCMHDKICAFKKLAWTMAKRKFAKERKEK